MTTIEIDAKIAELEGSLAQPGQYPTEIYTRIVGYYRSLANWNAGKREEYNHRQTFAEDANRIKAALDKAEAKFPTLKADSAAPCAAGGKAASYLLFTQKTCPQCPAMKAKVPTLGLTGQEFDVRAEAGFQAASTWTVTATPTLILLDAEGNELDRLMAVTELPRAQAFL